jgi:hypothetical protein
MSNKRGIAIPVFGTLFIVISIFLFWAVGNIVPGTFEGATVQKGGVAISLSNNVEYWEKSFDESLQLISKRAAYDLGKVGGIEGIDTWDITYPKPPDLVQSLGDKIKVNLIKGKIQDGDKTIEWNDNSLQTIIRLVGDLNGDLVVDQNDLDIFVNSNAFGSFLGSPNWDPLEDLNDDGKVDGQDLTLIARNSGKSAKSGGLSSTFEDVGYENFSVYSKTIDSTIDVNHQINQTISSSYFKLLYVARQIIENETFRTNLINIPILLPLLNSEFPSLNFQITPLGVDIVNITIKDDSCLANSEYYCIAPLKPGEGKITDPRNGKQIPYDYLSLTFKVNATHLLYDPITDFKLEVNPAYSSIMPGVNPSSIVKIINIGTVKKPVHLDFKIIPTTVGDTSTIGVQFNDTDKDPDFISNMTITTQLNTVPDTYIITVNGTTADGTSREVNFTLDIMKKYQLKIYTLVDIYNTPLANTPVVLDGDALHPQYTDSSGMLQVMLYPGIHTISVPTFIGSRNFSRFLDNDCNRINLNWQRDTFGLPLGTYNIDMFNRDKEVDALYRVFTQIKDLNYDSSNITGKLLDENPNPLIQQGLNHTCEPLSCPGQCAVPSFPVNRNVTLEFYNTTWNYLGVIDTFDDGSWSYNNWDCPCNTTKIRASYTSLNWFYISNSTEIDVDTSICKCKVTVIAQIDVFSNETYTEALSGVEVNVSQNVTLTDTKGITQYHLLPGLYFANVIDPFADVKGPRPFSHFWDHDCNSSFSGFFKDNSNNPYNFGLYFRDKNITAEYKAFTKITDTLGASNTFEFNGTHIYGKLLDEKNGHIFDHDGGKHSSCEDQTSPRDTVPVNRNISLEYYKNGFWYPIDTIDSSKTDGYWVKDWNWIPGVTKLRANYTPTATNWYYVGTSVEIPLYKLKVNTILDLLGEPVVQNVSITLDGTQTKSSGATGIAEFFIKPGSHNILVENPKSENNDIEDSWQWDTSNVGNPNNGFDRDWSTFSEYKEGFAIVKELYVNYSIPLGASGAKIEYKINPELGVNNLIDMSCWDYVNNRWSSNIIFRANQNNDFRDNATIPPECLQSGKIRTRWQFKSDGINYPRFYEQKIWWAGGARNFSHFWDHDCNSLDSSRDTNANPYNFTTWEKDRNITAFYKIFTYIKDTAGNKNKFDYDGATISGKLHDEFAGPIAQTTNKALICGGSSTSGLMYRNITLDFYNGTWNYLDNVTSSNTTGEWSKNWVCSCNTTKIRASYYHPDWYYNSTSAEINVDPSICPCKLTVYTFKDIINAPISNVQITLDTLPPQSTDISGKTEFMVKPGVHSIKTEDKSLVGAWHLDEGSGTIANDASGNHNTGTINGATWQATANCHSGSCLSFDGANDYIDIPHSSSLDLSNAVTVTAWIKPNSLSTLQSPVAKGVHLDWDYELWIEPSGGSIGFGIGLSPGSGIPATAPVNNYLAIGKWSYIAGTADTSTGKIYLYVDGQKVGESNFVGGINRNTYSLQIGKRNDGLPFDGTIDEVRVWNRALAPAEIRADMQNSMPTSLTFSHFWDHDCSQNNLGWFNDSSGSSVGTYNFDMYRRSREITSLYKLSTYMKDYAGVQNKFEFNGTHIKGKLLDEVGNVLLSSKNYHPTCESPTGIHAYNINRNVTLEVYNSTDSKWYYLGFNDSSLLDGSWLLGPWSCTSGATKLRANYTPSNWYYVGTSAEIAIDCCKIYNGGYEDSYNVYPKAQCSNHDYSYSSANQIRDYFSSGTSCGCNVTYDSYITNTCVKGVCSGDSVVKENEYINITTSIKNTGTLAQGWWFVGVEFWNVSNQDDLGIRDGNTAVFSWYNGKDKISGCRNNFGSLPNCGCSYSDPNANGTLDVGETITVYCWMPASYWPLTTGNRRIISWIHERDLGQDAGSNGCEGTSGSSDCGSAFAQVGCSSGCPGGKWWDDALSKKEPSELRIKIEPNTFELAFNAKVDLTGLPLSSLQVTTNSVTEGSQTFSTDSNGIAKFMLHPGCYTISVPSSFNGRQFSHFWDHNCSENTGNYLDNSSNPSSFKMFAHNKSITAFYKTSTQITNLNIGSLTISGKLIDENTNPLIQQGGYHPICTSPEASSLLSVDRNVKLDYSTDNGNSWNSINTNPKFYYDFNDNDYSSNWTVDTGTWRIANGELNDSGSSVTGEEYIHTKWNGWNSTDYLSANINISSGNDVWLSLRNDSGINYYVQTYDGYQTLQLYITDEAGYYRAKVADIHDLGINPKNWNSWRIEQKGNDMLAYINDINIINTTAEKVTIDDFDGSSTVGPWAAGCGAIGTATLSSPGYGGSANALKIVTTAANPANPADKLKCAVSAPYNAVRGKKINYACYGGRCAMCVWNNTNCMNDPVECGGSPSWKICQTTLTNSNASANIYIYDDNVLNDPSYYDSIEESIKVPNITNGRIQLRTSNPTIALFDDINVDGIIYKKDGSWSYPWSCVPGSNKLRATYNPTNWFYMGTSSTIAIPCCGCIGATCKSDSDCLSNLCSSGICKCQSAMDCCSILGGPCSIKATCSVGSCSCSNSIGSFCPL